MDQKLRGMALTTVSAFLFGITPMIASLTYQMGSNAVTLTFYRNLMVVPVLLVVMYLKKIPFGLTGREALLLVLVGVGFRASTTLMLYQSYAYIPTGTATTLHFLYPLFTALLCRFLFREKLGGWKLLALVLAAAGILCFLDLKGDVGLPGVILASVSGATYACYLTGMDKTVLKEMHPTKVACYMGFTNAMAMLAVGLPTHQLRPFLPPKALVLTFVVAICTSFLAVALLQVGIQTLGASSAAIFSMFEPITSVLAGCVFLAEPLSAVTVLGCALILGAVGLIIHADRQRAHAETPEGIY